MSYISYISTQVNGTRKRVYISITDYEVDIFITAIMRGIILYPKDIESMGNVVGESFLKKLQRHRTTLVPNCAPEKFYLTDNKGEY